MMFTDAAPARRDDSPSSSSQQKLPPRHAAQYHFIGLAFVIVASCRTARKRETQTESDTETIMRYRAGLQYSLVYLYAFSYITR